MQETDTSLQSSKRLAYLVFFLICTAVVLMGLMFYQHQRSTILRGARENLHTAHDLYSRQIAYWRNQHLTMARMLASDPRFRESAAALVTRFDAKDISLHRQLLREYLRALQLNFEYCYVFVADAHGNPVVHSTDVEGITTSEFKNEDLHQADIDLSLELDEAVFSSIYLPASARPDSPAQHLRMNLIVPLNFDNRDQTPALLVFVIDPEAFLVPLLQSWPVPHKTAEAILVRRHGDNVVRLTEPRFETQEPLAEKVPPEQGCYIGHFIQAGHDGFVKCRDYKQEQVFAWIAQIKGTPWMLVAKIDEREVLGPLRHSALVAGAGGAGAIGLSGLLILMWWRQHAYRYRNQILRREQENDALLQRLDNLSRYANDIILLCDQQGMVIDANERALDTYGYSIEVLRTMNIRDLCDVEHSEWAAMLIQLESGDGIKFECLNRRADAQEFPVEISAGWIGADKERMLQAIIRDISERKEAEERLRRQAYYDDLTGLPNRALATERLHNAVQRARRHDSQVALLFIDLDLFKHINDTLGHIVGDQVLALFARRIERVLDHNAAAARFGADEFLLQIENVRTTADVIALVDKVVESIGEPVTIEGFEISATVSIGISIAPDDSSDVNQLIRYADTAMYRAKERGRNCYQFFTPDMHRRVEQRLTLEGGLRHAVARGELVLHYQPQVDMRTGKVTGCEALVRWQHSAHGIISPYEFICLAEELGLIHEIGAWVVDEACRQVGEWQKNGYPELKVAVNVSPHQLQNKHLAEEILQSMMRHNLSPGTLEVEITETSLMRDTALAIAQMRDLSNGGVTLAIDDFGTGYSSLGHLHRFPLHKLKIDRSFVNNIDTDIEKGGGTIPRAIITLAHELGLEVIAEGIESESQRDFLLQADCVAGQGYLYSRPLSAEDFAAYLRDGPPGSNV
jgi:diguanylate cyclase (GGDEF)-like protein/PAS domain S-box-containing protein